MGSTSRIRLWRLNSHGFSHLQAWFDIDWRHPMSPCLDWIVPWICSCNPHDPCTICYIIYNMYVYIYIHYSNIVYIYYIMIVYIYIHIYIMIYIYMYIHSSICLLSMYHWHRGTRAGLHPTGHDEHLGTGSRCHFLTL